jgi:hypothetical protein
LSGNEQTALTSTLTHLLAYAANQRPLKVTEIQRDLKVQLNNESRLLKLRETQSIPPDLLEFVEGIKSIEERSSSIDVLESIYTYISSLKKRTSVIDNIRAGKVQELDDRGGNSISLESVNKRCKDFVSKKKKLEKIQIQLKDKIINRDDLKSRKKEDDAERLERVLPGLESEIIRELREVESLLASKGLKLR